MNDLERTLRKYLHELSDTDLSLEEIKVALLNGGYSCPCDSFEEAIRRIGSWIERHK